jgi:hypothetical protein
MGLLSPRVIEAIKKGVSSARSEVYAREPSLREGLTENWIAGNEQLARIMKNKHPDSDDMTLPRGGRFWEWGGRTGPLYRELPRTDKQPTSIRIPDAAPGSYFYHNHPVTSEAIPGATLSAQDLWVALRRGLAGMSSLDAEGGLGLAVVSPKAQRFVPEWFSPAGYTRLDGDPLTNLPAYMNELKDELAPAHGMHQIAGKDLLSPTGNPHPSLRQKIGPFRWPDIEPTSEGIGRALQNTGLLDHYSYTAPTVAAAAKREAILGKYIANAEDVATERLSKMLKERGFPDGKISAIIAAAVSSGSVGSLLSHLTREEAMNGSDA